MKVKTIEILAIIVYLFAGILGILTGGLWLGNIEKLVNHTSFNSLEVIVLGIVLLGAGAYYIYSASEHIKKIINGENR